MKKKTPEQKLKELGINGTGGLMMEHKKIELKPCPFCGSEADIFTSDEVGYLGNDRYTVKCGNCFCGTGHYKDRGRAVEAWNRRADDAR